MANIGTPASTHQRLPQAPAIYDQRYMQRLVSMLDFMSQQFDQPRLLRASNILVTDLPTSAVGLASGMVYNDGGFLKVVP